MEKKDFVKYLGKKAALRLLSIKQYLALTTQMKQGMIIFEWVNALLFD